MQMHQPLQTIAFCGRRTAIAVLACSGISAAIAQLAAGRVFRVAYLSGSSRETPSSMELFDVFRSSLRSLGYVEGRNVVIEARWTAGDPERLKAQALELAAWKPDVIVANATPVVAAAKAAGGDTIPIVMVTVSDPVAAGFVRSLAKPGGGITGTTDFGLDTAGKMVDLMLRLVPATKAIAVMVSANPVHPLQFRATKEAADAKGVRTVECRVVKPEDLEPAVAALETAAVTALIVLGGPPQSSVRERIADLSTRARIASLGPLRPYAEAGMLLSYGPDLRHLYAEAAAYVDKILRGAKAAELPVQQPRELELVLNLRTARALKLQIPQSVLVQANEVIG